MSTEETSINKQDIHPAHPDFKALCAVNLEKIYVNVGDKAVASSTGATA